MIIVQYHQRPIVLRSDVSTDDIATYDAIFKYSNPHELKHFVDKFIAHPELQSACIYYHDEAHLWQQFSAIYSIAPTAREDVFEFVNL